MRTIFIGDVHGCYDELIALTEKIGLQEEDHLYFVGDLINKGPKSLEVVEFVRNRKNTWSVMGNHEFFSFPSQKHMEQIDSDGPKFSEGMKNWIQQQHIQSKPLEIILQNAGHMDWLRLLPRIIERENFILVHGGLHPEYGIDTPVEIATMIRIIGEKPWYEFYNGNKPIIYGHWAVDGLRIRKNTIGLDTGCCFGGHLTAYCLESGEYWQVRANNVYKEPANWKEKND